MPKKTKKKQQKTSKKWVIAKTSDGTIQITYTIASDLINKTSVGVLKEHAQKLTIPGFRKGKAPINKVRDRLEKSELTQRTLSQILPNLVGETIRAEKFRLAIYPKFELISAEEGKDWQVRATTCELPELNIGDYKKDLLGDARASALWTPEKGAKDKKSDPTKEEKDQLVINSILSSTKVDIPEILINEEVNSRLSKLLERIEKLGLSLDQYLASVKKSAEDLRNEYKGQARDALILDLVLLNIAEKEGIKIKETDIDGALSASAVNQESFEQSNTPEQRNLVRTILLKRGALDALTSYL